MRLSSALDKTGIRGGVSFDASALIRLLVVNRICDPCSKLALLDWLDSVFHDLDTNKKPSYHHLLRAMDRLIEGKEKAEPLVARRLVGKQEKLSLVFYDITSTYFEGDRSLVMDDLRRYGYSRDSRPDRRQVVIGMVMTPGKAFRSVIMFFPATRWTRQRSGKLFLISGAEIGHKKRVSAKKC